jgi:hypothetical protein
MAMHSIIKRMQSHFQSSEWLPARVIGIPPLVRAITGSTRIASYSLRL